MKNKDLIVFVCSIGLFLLQANAILAMAMLLGRTLSFDKDLFIQISGLTVVIIGLVLFFYSIKLLVNKMQKKYQDGSLYIIIGAVLCSGLFIGYVSTIGYLARYGWH